MKRDLIYGDLTYKINGILFGTHNALGRYANEQQYGDAIEQKLKNTNFIYEREKEIPESFKGEAPGRHKVDFFIDSKVILEIKAKRAVGREDYYQVQRYLRAFDKKLGLLVNFRNKHLRIKRILNSDAKE